MKHLRILSLLAILALLLVACAGGGDATQETTLMPTIEGGEGTAPAGGAVGTEMATGMPDAETPGAAVTGSPAAASPEAETPAAQQTASPGTDATGIPDTGAGPAATVTGTPGAAGTAAAGVPDDETAQDLLGAPNRLSSLFGAQVQSMDGTAIGEVTALTVARPAGAAAAGGAAGTVTPEFNITPQVATGGAPTPGTSGLATGTGVQPLVEFLLVQPAEGLTTSGEGALPIPFGAIAPLALDAQGPQPLMLNAEPDILAEAPLVTEEQASNPEDPTWNTDALTYWEQQGLAVPVTGAEQPTVSNAYLREGLEGIDVLSMDGEPLGTVNDFVIDLTTGQIVFLILEGGEGVGADGAGRYFPIPFTRLSWTDQDDDSQDQGEIVLNVPVEAFANAASVEDPNQLDTTTQGWAVDYASYWESVE